MMKEITKLLNSDITKVLFERETVNVNGVDVTIGSTGVPVLSVSSLHPQNTTTQGKASRVVEVLSLILKKEIQFLYNAGDMSVYVEYGQYRAYVTDTAIISNIDATVDSKLVVKLLSVLALCIKTNELDEYISNINDEIENMGMPGITDLYKISDYTWYSFFSKLNGVSVLYNETLEEEVKQAIRTSSLTVAETFKDKSSFVTNNISLKVEQIKEEKTIKVATPEEVLADAKAGKYLLGYDFEDMSEFIPDLSVLDSYVPTKEYAKIVKKIEKHIKRILTRLDMGKTGKDAIGNDYINIELTGRPGTGKTMLAEMLAATFGLPIFVSKNSDDVEDDEFEGKTKPIDGKFTFVETAFVKGFVNGGIIVDEEYNLTKPGIKMGAIGQAIEAPFILKRNGYEDVHRHPLTIYIGTSNANTEGTKDTNQALSSRMKNAYVLENPDESTFINILMNWDDEFKKGDCKKVYSIYTKIINFLCSPENQAEDIALKISIRQCFGALDSLYEGNSLKDAIDDSIVGKIHQSDPELAGRVRATFLANL